MLYEVITGYHIIFTYKSAKNDADNLINILENEGVKAASLQLDVSNNASFSDFIHQLKSLLNEKWGPTAQLDLLINNAGFGINKPFTETTETDFA